MTTEFPRRGTKCFRVSDIPSTWKSKDLVTALRLADNSLRNWELGPRDQISVFPSYTGAPQTALLILLNCPEFFNDKRIAKGLRVKTQGIELAIDTHFNGITPLSFPGGRIDADVVAVTGLAGHGFGSWKSRDSGNMWLFDFLPETFKNIRVFTFGYNSSLVGNVNSDFSTMIDYRNSLLSAVESVRKTKDEKARPLVLVGHSMGGIVILGSLVQAKNDPKHKHIFEKTAGVILFGTPHQGLQVEDFLEILADQNASTSTRNELVKQLEVGSAFLEAQGKNVKNLWPAGPRPLVVNFYETLTTPRPVKTAKGWVSGTGHETIKRSSPDSSVLFWELERRESVAADHSNMVKFGSKSDPTYETFVKLLEEVLKK